MAFRQTSVLSHKHIENKKKASSSDLPWKNSTRAVGSPCIKCIRAVAFCSWGPFGFETSHLSTDNIDEPSAFTSTTHAQAWVEHAVTRQPPKWRHLSTCKGINTFQSQPSLQNNIFPNAHVMQGAQIWHHVLRWVAHQHIAQLRSGKDIREQGDTDVLSD